ncbi:Uncharacterised protein [Bordetella pertussis]|nr:Uncharacterised protein [Bordetella pertussis]
MLVTQLGAFIGDHDITGKRQLESARERIAVDARDHCLRRSFQRLECGLHQVLMTQMGPKVANHPLREPLQVVPRAEGPAGPADYDHAYLGLRVPACVYRPPQVHEQPAVERIHAFGAVERQAPDARQTVIDDQCRCHITPASPAPRPAASVRFHCRHRPPIAHGPRSRHLSFALRKAP